MSSDSSHIRRVLELARSEINQQRPDAAHGHLKTVHHEIEEQDDQQLAAEYQLLVAETFKAKQDPAAEQFFQEAIRLLEQIEPSPTDLLLRALEHYGDDLCSRRIPSKAREPYSKARRIATEFHFEEDNARLHLKLIRIDLETHSNLELENFKTMKCVVERSGFTSIQQLLVWMMHSDQVKESSWGLRAARGKSSANELYFQDLFQKMSER